MKSCNTLVFPLIIILRIQQVVFLLLFVIASISLTYEWGIFATRWSADFVWCGERGCKCSPALHQKILENHGSDSNVLFLEFLYLNFLLIWNKNCHIAINCEISDFLLYPSGVKQKSTSVFFMWLKTQQFLAPKFFKYPGKYAIAKSKTCPKIYQIAVSLRLVYCIVPVMRIRIRTGFRIRIYVFFHIHSIHFGLFELIFHV
jgi:hypothetical protein